MGAEPPIPPRPDLPGDGPPASWRDVDPGGMGATAIVGAGFRLWTESWLRWGLVTLLFSGAIAIVIAAIDPWTATYGAEFWFGDRGPFLPDPHPVATALLLIQALFLGPWLYVILAWSSLRASTEDPVRIPLIGHTIRGVHSLLWIFVLLVLLAILAAIPLVLVVAATASVAGGDVENGLAAVVGAIVGLTLLLWIVPRLATIAQVFVGEDQRGTKAIAGAWRLSRGAWGTALGVVLLNVLIAIAVSIVPSSIVSEIFPRATVEDAVARTVVYSLVNAFLVPIGFAITSALYLELRARKGQLDQHSLRTNLSRFG